MIFVILFNFISSEALSNHYTIKKFLDINSRELNNSWLISSIENTSKFSCLSECNLLVQCLTAVFNRNSYYCILYKKFLNSNETIPFVGSSLYEKRSKKYLLFALHIYMNLFFLVTLPKIYLFLIE